MRCKTINAGNRQAKISGLPDSPLILVLAMLCGFSATARSQNTPLQLRLEKALENARAITNVEIQYDDILWIKGKPISAAESNDFSSTMKASYPFANDFTRTSHITYRASDRKYRQEVRNESPQTNIIKFKETAFDGKLWSDFNGSSAQMVQQDGDMLGDKNDPHGPLIQPFLFLSKESDDCFPCGGLRFTDLRSPDILNGLILSDAKSSNGILQLSFPGLPRFGVPQLWSITIDEAGPDFKPRSISSTLFTGSKGHYALQ